MQEQLYADIYHAETTHWWFCARRHIVAKMIETFAVRRRPLLIADIGCGMGSTSQMLTKFGRVLAMDYSPTALAFSLQRGLTGLVAAALPNLPCPDNTFDVACALDVIEHLDDDQSAIREILRVCKPGGLIVITVPAYQWLWSEHDDINEHKRRYTRRMLLERIGCLDVKLLKLSYMNTFLSLPVIVYRMWKNLWPATGRKKKSPRSDVFAVPPLVNRILTRTFAAESICLKHGNLPFGTSLICVARKDER